MKLPRGEDAVADIAKVRDYCLSPSHPRGRRLLRTVPVQEPPRKRGLEEEQYR